MLQDHFGKTVFSGTFTHRHQLFSLKKTAEVNVHNGTPNRMAMKILKEEMRPVARNGGCQVGGGRCEWVLGSQEEKNVHVGQTGNWAEKEGVGVAEFFGQKRGGGSGRRRGKRFVIREWRCQKKKGDEHSHQGEHQPRGVGGVHRNTRKAEDKRERDKKKRAED